MSKKLTDVYKSTVSSKPSRSSAIKLQRKHQEKSPILLNSESQYIFWFCFPPKKNRSLRLFVSISVVQGFPIATFWWKVTISFVWLRIPFKCLFIKYKMKNHNNFHLKMKIKFFSLLFLYEPYLFCLEQHCLKSARIRSYSGPHFPAFGLNAERYLVSLCIQSKCGKIWTRITSKTDTFHSVICHYWATQKKKEI